MAKTILVLGITYDEHLEDERVYMFSKKEIDNLVSGCLAALPVGDFLSESDFQAALCDALRRSSDPTLWEWTREDPYATLGLPNKGAVYFDICGVYNQSCKVQIELKYVVTPSVNIPPKDFPAFSYDLLKDCIKIELAMSGLADTAPLSKDYPVVYGLSIGLTNYPAFWQDEKKGKNGWSRQSLEHLRKCGHGFEIIQTVAKTKEQLHNAIFRNKRYHLSFSLNWGIAWSEEVNQSRFVIITPDSLINYDKDGPHYSHDLTDESYTPFVSMTARSNSKKNTAGILSKSK